MITGDDALAYADWSVRAPMDSGAVKHWEDMEPFLGHVFGRLGVEDLSGATVLLADAPMVSAPVTKSRRRAAELLFERFGVSGVCFIRSPVLALQVACPRGRPGGGGCAAACSLGVARARCGAPPGAGESHGACS